MLQCKQDGRSDRRNPEARISVTMPLQPFVKPTPRLTDRQLESLRSCARGVSLRFEEPAIVNALIDAGYVEKNVVGVVTITAQGLEYLQTHGS